MSPNLSGTTASNSAMPRMRYQCQIETAYETRDNPSSRSCLVELEEYEKKYHKPRTEYSDIGRAKNQDEISKSSTKRFGTLAVELGSNQRENNIN